MQLVRLGAVLLVGCLLLCSAAAAENRLRLINSFNAITTTSVLCGDRNETKTLFFEQDSAYFALGSSSCSVEISNAGGDPIVPTFDIVPSGSQTLIYYNNTGFAYRLFNDTAPVDRLPIDAAVVRIIALGALTDVRRLSLTGVSEECWNCAQSFITADLTQPFVQWIDTRWTVDLTVNRSQPAGSAVLAYHYNEHSYYTVVVSFTASDDPNVQVYEDRRGDDAFRPIWMLAVILFIVAAVWALGWKLYAIATRRSSNEDFDSSSSFSSVQIQAGSRNAQNGKPKKERLRSLDAMRGLCISVMIFVNYGGGGYWFFNHSLWNGLTFADLVFPWFIFMMGVAMALSLDGLRESTPTRLVVYKVARRSAILFALGLLVNGNYDFEYFRVMGVLQRFGVSYFIVAMVILFVPKLKLTRTLEDEEELLRRDGDANGAGEMRVRPRGVLGGVYPYLIEWLVVLMLVALHTLLTFLLKVPGCPKGYLGPGGVANDGEHPTCAGGAAGYIDHKILGSHHVYGGPTCGHYSGNYDSRVFGSGGLYDCPPYDPEGLLGCLTSVFLCYLGVQTGRFIRAYKYHAARLGRWLVLGAIVGGIGVGLAWGRQNGGWIPINKNLWSLSFVLVLGGSGMWLLSFLYTLIDVLDIWNGAPFIYVGMNSITIYVASEILSSNCPCDGVDGPRFPFGWYVAYPTHLNQLAQHVTAVAIFQLIAYYMFVCDFFLNV